MKAAARYVCNYPTHTLQYPISKEVDIFHQGEEDKVEKRKSLSHVAAALLRFQAYTCRAQMMVDAHGPDPVFSIEISAYNLYYPTPVHRINSSTLMVYDCLGCGKLYNHKTGLCNHRRACIKWKTVDRLAKHREKRR